MTTDAPAPQPAAPADVPQWRHTPIRSRPLRPDYSGRIVSGVITIAIGLMIWFIGARYTIDGAIWLFNAFPAWLRMVERIPPVSGIGYVPCLILPILLSKTEWRFPVQRVAGRWIVQAPHVWLVWLLVVAGDCLSTFFGLRTPGPAAWEIMRQVAESLTASAILAVVLTFAGEWLIRRGLGDLWS